MRISRGFAASLAVTALGLALAIMPTGGCKKDDSGVSAISGTVTVEGGDASGVTVQLFSAPALASDSMWAIISRTSSIGFNYSLQAVFDPRREKSRIVDQQVTGANGSFKFDSREDGGYVIVASKRGFGWNVPSGVDVHGGDVNTGAIQLRADHVVPSNEVVTENTRWSAGHYVLSGGGLTVAPGATLTLDPGCVIRFGADSRMLVQGDLVCQGKPDSFIVFTTDRNPPLLPGEWSEIRFAAGAARPHMTYCSINYSYWGIRSDRPGAQIEYSYFADIGAGNALWLTGLGAADGDSIVVRHNVLNHIPIELNVSEVRGTGLAIDHNAFFHPVDFAVNLDRVTGGSIFCNWFYNCGREDTSNPSAAAGAIEMASTHDVDISRNEIHYAWFAISTLSHVDSSVAIHNNRFYATHRILHLGVSENERGPSYPVFQSNCIRSNVSYYVYNSACQHNNHEIDAVGNFWGTASVATIRNWMWAPQNVDPPCPAIVFEPILTACPDAEVGICGN
jgi:hypothetical protein